MADPTFAVTFSGPQMDFVGKLVVDTLNAASAQAKMAQEVFALLRSSVQPAPPAARPSSNGLQVVPEVEVDVSPRSPVP
jgi:hypothetical protein